MTKSGILAKGHQAVRLIFTMVLPLRMQAVSGLLY
jgi:hypothetical protein